LQLFFFFTADECQKKWKNVRDYYMKDKRSQKKVDQQHVSEESQRILMHFLFWTLTLEINRKYIIYFMIVIYSSSYNILLYTTFLTHIFRTASNFSSTISEYASDNDDEFPEPNPLPRPPASSSAPSPSVSSTSRKTRTSLEDAVTNYLEGQTKQNAVPADAVQDGDMLFFKSLLPLIKKLPEEKKETLKLEIHSMVIKSVYAPAQPVYHQPLPPMYSQPHNPHIQTYSQPYQPQESIQSSTSGMHYVNM
jgi:hypothetical protein